MERFYKIDLILRVITIIQNVEQCVCVNRISGLIVVMLNIQNVEQCVCVNWISGLIVVMLNSMHHSYLSSF